MITKEQVESKALNYTAHRAVSKTEYDAYIAGFNAGMDEMQSENARLREAIEEAITERHFSDAIAGLKNALK